MHLFYSLISKKKKRSLKHLQVEVVRGYTKRYDDTRGGTRIHDAGLHEHEAVKQTQSGL